MGWSTRDAVAPRTFTTLRMGGPEMVERPRFRETSLDGPFWYFFFAWLERLSQHPAGFWVTGSEVASSDFLLWLLGTWASVAHTVASKLSSLAAPRAGPSQCRTVQMTSGHGNAMSLAQLACGWLPVRYYAWQSQELLEIRTHLETKATFLFVDFVDGCSLMLFMCQLSSFMPGIVSCPLIF